MSRFCLLTLMLVLTCYSTLAQFGKKQVISSSVGAIRMISVSDLNGDNEVDVLAVSGNRITWFKNEGNGFFGEANIIQTNLGTSFYLSTGDLDNDGDKDILYTSFEQSLVLWYKNLDGLGNFGPAITIDSSLQGPDDVTAADIDGDGDLDVLVTADIFDSVTWFENLDGAGNFGAGQLISTSTNGRSSRAGDFDGDGDLDVATSDSGGDSLHWFENLDGTGTFGPENTIDSGSAGIQRIMLADVNNDNNLDILSAMPGGEMRVAWHRNNGDGTFSEDIPIVLNENGALSVFAADLDNDLDLDVLSASNADNNFAWYENLDGEGNFGPQQIIDQGMNHHRDIIAADIDNDGDMDVVAAVQNEHTVMWYENLTILGNTNTEYEKITITPNPVSGLLKIQPTKHLNKVEVLNIQGKLLDKKTNNTAVVDVSHLTPGVYFIKLYTDNTTLVKKIIKR